MRSNGSLHYTFPANSAPALNLTTDLVFWLGLGFKEPALAAAFGALGAFFLKGLEFLLDMEIGF
jgi:hypothetical protein